MLDSILDAEDVPEGMQHRLLAAYKDGGYHYHLTRMCHASWLAPSVDAELAKITNSKVRAAWFTRPGRKTEDIVPMVAKERRIGVQVELAAMDVDVEGFFEPLARTEHPKVMLALLANERVPLDIRTAASRGLYLRWHDLGWDKRATLRTLWASYPETCTGALEVADLRGPFSELLVATTASQAAKDNVVAQLRILLMDAEATVRTATYPRAVQTSANKVAEALTLVLSADWCDAKLRRRLDKTITAICQGPSSTHLSVHVRQDLDYAIERAGDAEADALGELTERAASCSDTDVDDVLATLTKVPAQRAYPVKVALLHNAGLSVRSQLTVAQSVPWWGHHDQMALLRPGPAATAAMVLAGVHVPGPIPADLVLEHLGDVDEHLAQRAVYQMVAADCLDDPQLMKVPCNLLSTTIAHSRDGVGSDIARRVGTLLAAELDGESDMVWEQFRQLCRTFPGTTSQLLDVCRASAE